MPIVYPHVTPIAPGHSGCWRVVFGHGRRGHGPLSQSIPRGLEGRLSAVSLRPWHRSPPVAPGRPLVTIMGHQDPDLRTCVSHFILSIFLYL